MHFLELRVPPLLQVLIVGLTMYGLTIAFPAFRFLIPGSHWIAVGLVAVGVSIALMGVGEFRKAQTTVDPRCPEASASLVVCGIYQYSRNPMYLGFFLLLLGWALYLSNGLTFVLLPLFIVYMNRFQIRPEERFMLQKFGDDYLLYVRQVRRWV